MNAAYNGSSTTNHLYLFENRGNLTINDTVGGGEINARGIYNGRSGSYADAVMVVNNAIINAIDVNGIDETFAHVFEGGKAKFIPDNKKAFELGYEAAKNA